MRFQSQDSIDQEFSSRCERVRQEKLAKVIPVRQAKLEAMETELAEVRAKLAPFESIVSVTIAEIFKAEEAAYAAFETEDKQRWASFYRLPYNEQQSKRSEYQSAKWASKEIPDKLHSERIELEVKTWESFGDEVKALRCQKASLISDIAHLKKYFYDV